MKLVQFDDGTFGVRLHWLWGWYFVDLHNPDFEWKRGHRHFQDCRGTEEQARAQMIRRGKLSYRVIE